MNKGENVAITNRVLKQNEKVLRKKGLPEVMAYAFRDKSLEDWKGLKFRGRNSGFKKQYYKRIKAERLKIKTQAREQGFWTPEMTRDHRILNIAYNNDGPAIITFALLNELPIQTPQTIYPDITSQGVLNWVALEGSNTERRKMMKYRRILSIFNLTENEGNLWGKSLVETEGKS